MLFAADVLSRNPGATIIYDVKSTRNLQPWIERHGGVPQMWKTGHSLIKARMKEIGSPLAGEMSGHSSSANAGTVRRWTAARDCSRFFPAPIGVVLDALPDSISTPNCTFRCRRRGPRVDREDARRLGFPDAQRIVRIDGLRVEFADGFDSPAPRTRRRSSCCVSKPTTTPALQRIQRDVMAAVRRFKPDAMIAAHAH
jgi:phosphomannomutase